MANIFDRVRTLAAPKAGVSGKPVHERSWAAGEPWAVADATGGVRPNAIDVSRASVPGTDRIDAGKYNKEMNLRYRSMTASLETSPVLGYLGGRGLANMLEARRENWLMLMPRSSGNVRPAFDYDTKDGNKAFNDNLLTQLKHVSMAWGGAEMDGSLSREQGAEVDRQCLALEDTVVKQAITAELMGVEIDEETKGYLGGERYAALLEEAKTDELLIALEGTHEGRFKAAQRAAVTVVNAYSAKRDGPVDSAKQADAVEPAPVAGSAEASRSRRLGEGSGPSYHDARMPDTSGIESAGDAQDYGLGVAD